MTRIATTLVVCIAFRGKVLAIMSAIAIWSAGCGPTYEERHAAIEAEYQQAIARNQAEYEATMRDIRAQSANCIRKLTSLPIGSSVLELKGIECMASKINSTKLGTATLDQWVYEFTDDQRVYMYYRNGNLTAIQY